MIYSRSIKKCFLPGAPTTPEMMIKIDGTQYREKERVQGKYQGFVLKWQCMHVKHSVFPRYRLTGGGGGVETAVVLQTGCTSSVGL